MLMVGWIAKDVLILTPAWKNYRYIFLTDNVLCLMVLA